MKSNHRFLTQNDINVNFDPLIIIIICQIVITSSVYLLAEKIVKPLQPAKNMFNVNVNILGYKTLNTSQQYFNHCIVIYT